MKFILKINGTKSHKAAYIGWTPVKCTLTIDDYSGDSTIPVVIKTGHLEDEKGRISLYYDNGTSSEPVETIRHNFQSQKELTFYIAGKFPHASVAKKDTFVTIEEFREPRENKPIEISPLEKKIMVRVRKNANKMTNEEINLFLESFVRLNILPTRETYEGEFEIKPSKLLHEIVLMHTDDSVREIHQRSSFHPWHRAFLLHLEREMQERFPEVTIPYWKFDKKAENVFTEHFIGKTKQTKLSPGSIKEELSPDFEVSNPMFTYKDHTVWGPLKRAYFQTNPAEGKPYNRIRDEKEIICSDKHKQFLDWYEYEERGSHNGSHVAFTGHVVDAGKDPVDPLFFMLHSNVDRLWALWQHEYDRFDSNKKETYPFQGRYSGKRGKEWAQVNQHKFNTEGNFYEVYNTDLGNYAEDNLWPWDFDQILSRPMRIVNSGKDTVPQINITFPKSFTSNYPVGSITIKSSIDYQDRINNQTSLGFDYDTIPYFDHDKRKYCEIPMPDTEKKTKIFLDKSLPVAERLKAADLVSLRNEEQQVAAFNILKDKEEDEAIRRKVIGLVDETKEAFLDNSLEIISDESESTELKSELIHLVFASKRFNRHFPSRKPRFFDLLRGFIKSEDKNLRFQSIDILASHEDEVVQDFLIEEIKKDESEFISKPDAIFFLRQSNKPQHAELFRELFERSEDPEVRKAAIEGLGNDPDSAELLKEVVQDEKESFKIREAGALSLHHLDHETMNDLATQIVAEPENSEGIKLFSSVSPDPDEVDFKTGLLNMLTYTADPSSLTQNEGLKSSLNQLVDQSQDDKSNFRSSAETLAETPVEGPTIIEQMATKLLSRLEASDDE